MFNFEFYNPTKIIFGKDQIEKLDKQIPKDAKVLMTYGGGSIKKFGTYDKVKEALGQRTVVEFSGIEPNPKYETLMKAVVLAKEEKIDFLLAVGGGSVIDGTKFINLALSYDGDDHEQLLFNGKLANGLKGGLPLGTVLTLPATGSEMNRGAVVSYQDGKFPVFNNMNFPTFSVVDPTLTYSLPKAQVANGIVDTFIHTVEQYVTYPAEGRFQDRTAEGILQTLVEVGLKTIENPEDYDARANLVWAATMALNGLIGVGVPQDWSTHTIGHELTAMYGIDHGKTLAILQPAIWSIRKDKKKEKLIQYAKRVWDITEGTDDEKVDKAIGKTREFFESLGVKTRLSEYGIQENQLVDIVANLEKHGHKAISESSDLTLEISKKILIEAL